MASKGDFPSLRSASRAKSIIMMASFLTMPMRRMMPIKAMTLNSVRQRSQARIAPTPADERVERKRDDRKLALMVEGESRSSGLETCEGAERHLLAGGGMDVNILE